MATRSLRQSAADTPLARWLVEYAEGRGWTSGRQAARYLGINPAVFGTWLRGEFTPDATNQEQLARATGHAVAVVADLVQRTKALTAGRATVPAFPDARDLIRETVHETLAQMGHPRVAPTEHQTLLADGDAIAAAFDAAIRALPEEYRRRLPSVFRDELRRVRREIVSHA